MRFRFIEDRRADYPVKIMCDVLEVSPAGYYAWRARPESRRAVANRDLVDDIKRVHRDTSGRYGSPRIHAELRAQGRGVSRGRIERLMRRHGIRAIMARPRRVGELARMTLPAVNVALGGFKGILEGIHGVIPGGGGQAGALVGGRAIAGVAAGAAAGFGIGALGGPVGAAGGAVVGGMLGAAEGFMEGYVKAQQDKKTTGEFIEDLKRGTGLAPPGPQLKTMLAPISLSLNIDGQTLARVMSSIAANSFSGQSPAFDGLESYVGGDHQHTDK
jgi:hypothetical protein